MIAPRIDRSRSQLLIVDIQERLAPHVEGQQALIARVGALLAVASRFGIPALATEHAADRIGRLISAIRDRLTPESIFAKQCFGAMDETGFGAWLRAYDRRQVVICGMEAHVCVMQTALAIADAGYETFVVADATGSRNVRRDDRTLSLERMRDAGCVLVGTETTLFEWAHAADDPAFRDVLRLVKDLPAA